MNISCSYLPFLNIIYGLLNSSEHTLGESFWKRTKYLPLALSPNSINLSLINILHALLQKNWRIHAPAINLLPFNPESHLLAHSTKKDLSLFSFGSWYDVEPCQYRVMEKHWKKGFCFLVLVELTQQAPPAGAACLAPGSRSVVASAASGSWCTCSFPGT